MIVHVRLFARAKDLAGTDRLAVELPDGATVGDLRKRLGEEQPRLAALLARSALAVDDEFADDALVLTDGAEVALLPPVSGGCYSGRESHNYQSVGGNQVAGVVFPRHEIKRRCAIKYD